jgi:uncharacterized protein YaiI (UPF0178 family)
MLENITTKFVCEHSHTVHTLNITKMMLLELPNVVVYKQIQVLQDDIIVVTASAIFAKLLVSST